MRAVGRPGYADQHHAVGALGLIADRVAARQVGRNMTETLKT
jgi:hypothetical protein